MCISLEVILPTIEKFLLVHSLRCGSIVILLWTTIRSIFCIIFFSTVILEVLIGQKTPLGFLFVTQTPVTDHFYLIYYIYVLLLISSSLLFVFMLHLFFGVCCLRAYLLEHYLICRFITWLIEVIGLFILCMVHKLLIGWYLGILFFVMLESYSFIAVYSYYVKIIEDEKQEC